MLILVIFYYVILSFVFRCSFILMCCFYFFVMNKFRVVLSVIFYYLLNFKILILILNFSRFDVYIDVDVVL